MCLINLFFSGLIFILYYFAQNNLYYDYDLLIQLLLFLTISEINMLMLMLKGCASFEVEHLLDNFLEISMN